MTRILGIDPGVTGGIALFCPADNSIVATDIPTVDHDVDVDELARYVRSLAPTMAVIERASARPGQGVSSTFRYGTAYGGLRAVVALLCIPSHLVTPGKWKKHFALDADKERSRALAIRLWPGVGCFARVKDHGRAEASLIAKYGAEVLAHPARAA
jgi:crossover junction endodeoxyribonuclease RuvC